MIVLSSAIILISILLDQITKIAADKFLLDGPVNVIPHILTFSHVKNPGAAFGILSDNRWIFMIISTIAIIVMIYLMVRIKNPSYFFNISLSMLVGGGIGNMIDRISRGYVVDFLKVEFIDFPVFNVADCFVTVGAFLLAIYLLFMYEDKDESTKQNTNTPLSENKEPATCNENISDQTAEITEDIKDKNSDESE